jgi:hypothetical protein
MTRHACGRHGADVRPDFDWEMEARRAAAIDSTGARGVALVTILTLLAANAAKWSCSGLRL